MLRLAVSDRQGMLRSCVCASPSLMMCLFALTGNAHGNMMNQFDTDQQAISIGSFGTVSSSSSFRLETFHRSVFITTFFFLRTLEWILLMKRTAIEEVALTRNNPALSSVDRIGTNELDNQMRFSAMKLFGVIVKPGLRRYRRDGTRLYMTDRPVT